MKKRNIFLILFALLFSACANKSQFSEKINDTNKTSFINQYLQNYYKPLTEIEITEMDFLTDEINIDIMNERLGITYSFNSIDDDGNLYFYKNTDSLITDELSEIGYYNVFNKEVIIIKEADDISIQFNVQFVDSKYILWAESYDNSDWYKYRYHLYSKETGLEKIYYNPDIIYTRFTNPPCILNEAIYFEDIYNADDESFYINLLKYNILDESIEIIDSQSKKPSLFQEGIAYIKQTEDKESIINIVDKYGNINNIMKLDKYYNAIFCSGNRISYTYPLYDEINNDKMIGSGIGYFENDVGIDILKPTEIARYVQNFYFHNNIAVFSFSEASYPMFYNLIDETLYIIKNAEAKFYTVLVCDSFIIYIYTDVKNNENLQPQYKFLLMYL